MVYAEAGDIIYIVLLVAFVLSGLFKSKNKKQKQADLEKTMLPEDIFEKFENEPLDENDDWIPRFGETAQTVVDTPVVEKVFRKTEKTKTKLSFDNNDDISKLRIKKKQASVGLELEEDAETEKNEILDSIHFDSADDVKRAFIYTEIFNRRY